MSIKLEEPTIISMISLYTNYEAALDHILMLSLQ